MEKQIKKIEKVVAVRGEWAGGQSSIYHGKEMDSYVESINESRANGNTLVQLRYFTQAELSELYAQEQENS